MKKFDMYLVFDTAPDFCEENITPKVIYITQSIDVAVDFILHNITLFNHFPGWDPVNFILPVDFNTAIRYKTDPPSLNQEVK